MGTLASIEYVDVWRHLREVVLTDQPDMLSWCWTNNVVYTARSCYCALFHGSIPSVHWRTTWKTWAPLNIKVFHWLVSLDLCWTSDRLARRGIPHEPRCVLCFQEDETLQHLLVGCVLARITWHAILSWCL